MSNTISNLSCKLIIVGDSTTGKSSILIKYTHGDFTEYTKSTIGVEFAIKLLNIDDSIVKLQIWDTAGQERFKAITNAYYRGSMGCFVVFDITRKITFDHVDKWVSELKEYANEDVIIFLVGNKSDLEKQREVSTEMASRYATSRGFIYFETSAKNGDNIHMAFEQIARKIYNRHVTNLSNDKQRIIGNAATSTVIELENELKPLSLSDVHVGNQVNISNIQRTESCLC